MKLSNQTKAERVYSRYYGHLDDKYFYAEKTQEILDWLNDGTPCTLAEAIAEWADVDAEEIETQRRDK